MAKKAAKRKKPSAEPQTFLTTDGDLVLEITPSDDGWLCVSAPFVPGLNTQAKTIAEAFELAHEVRQELEEVRKQLELEQAERSALATG
jgi:predicted RNase H-like HicB family nuclease